MRLGQLYTNKRRHPQSMSSLGPGVHVQVLVVDEEIGQWPRFAIIDRLAAVHDDSPVIDHRHRLSL